MTRQATLYISERTERMAAEIAERRGLPAERYRTRLYEQLVYEEYVRTQEVTSMRREDAMAVTLDEVVGKAGSEAEVREMLASVGWSEDDIDAALDDPDFQATW